MPEEPNIKLRELPQAPRETRPAPEPYAELDVTTNFSFLRGASHADELIFRAAELGYRAIAITDRNSLAGIVRAHEAIRLVKDQGGIPPKLIIGARLVLADGPELLVWPTNRAAYASLCRLLTLGKRRTDKGQCLLYLQDILDQNQGLLAAIVGGTGEEQDQSQRQDDKETRRQGDPTIWSEQAGAKLWELRDQSTAPDSDSPPSSPSFPRLSTQHSALSTSSITLLRESFGPRLSLAISALHGPDDQSHLAHFATLSKTFDIPLLATNQVHYHDPNRRELQDVLTCIRHLCTIHDAGHKLFPNGERYLKPPDQMHRLFAHYPSAIRRALDIAEQCNFSLDQLKYEYPDEVVPKGIKPIDHLGNLAYAGALERYAEEDIGYRESGIKTESVASSPDALHPSGADILVCHSTPPENQLSPALAEMPPNPLALSRFNSLATNNSQLATLSPSLPEKLLSLLHRELTFIENLHYEAYFLTVYDMVRFARSRNILCQGRGSAANSAVCYCLGVTSVDPMKIDLLFERFISSARNEPPDIDVDFEHERREEVIQYLYEKYGRDRAGMTAVVITYRGRSAVRDVGKALGLSLDLVDQMAKKLDWWHRGTIGPDALKELGLDPTNPTIAKVIELTTQLLGFPRHLSQHVGGMVMTQGPLCELVPIENATMADRTVIEWDKDDIDVLGILKVDALALGMLTAISKAFTLLEKSPKSPEGATKSSPGRKPWDPAPNPSPVSTAITSPEGATDESPDYTQLSFAPPGLPQNPSDPHGLRRGLYSYAPPGLPDISSQLPHPPSVFSVPSVVPSPPPRLQLHTIPHEDPAVYTMISNADTIGVFQVESRAQMSMLPRLRPRTFYDLVIEVAIVRPGPIQGNMVHPYLRRRTGEEPVSYPSDALRNVLEKTLGVPLFQEQAMRVAMVGASFSAEEADQLRRAMAAWKRSGAAIHKFHEKIITGMLANGYTLEFAEQCFNQIKGFGEYGFPESHAASFALLVYVSAWLKHYHPAAFCAALLNSQPMGFYAPAQLVRDAKEHGVTVHCIDINHSEWDCTLEGSGFGVQGSEKKDEGGGMKDETKTSPSPSNNPDQHTPPPPLAEPAPKSLALSRFNSLATNNAQLATLPPSSLATHNSQLTTLSPSLRLGFRLIKSLPQSLANRIATARQRVGRFTSIAHFRRATALPAHAIRKLAEADAFSSLGLTRRLAVWEALALKDEEAPLFDHLENEETQLPLLYSGEGRGEGLRSPSPSGAKTSTRLNAHSLQGEGEGEGSALAPSPRSRIEDPHPNPLPSTGEGISASPLTTINSQLSTLSSSQHSALGSTELAEVSTQHSFLPPMPLGQEVLTDYATTTLSLKKHPVALVRDHLSSLRILRAADLQSVTNGKWVKVAGLVLIRQRPGTASGIVFITLEDETGIANLIVKSNTYDQYRPAARHSSLLQCDGYVQRQGQIIHVTAKRLFDLSHLLSGYTNKSRDFH